MKKPFIIFLRLCLIPIFSLFIKEVEGKENLSLSPPFILASNHLNTLDHFFIACLLKDQLKNLSFFAGNEKLKNLLFFGWLFWLGEVILVNRKKIPREKIIEILQENLKRGKVVVIYPEGDTNKKEFLLEGKTGIAELAFVSEAKIIPLGFQKQKGSFKRIIKIGKALDFKKEKELFYTLKGVEEKRQLLRKTTDKIMLEISRLCGKAYPYANKENFNC